MKSYIVILKLSEADTERLQQKVKEGTATEFEEKMYHHAYNLSAQDQADSVASYL